MYSVLRGRAHFSKKICHSPEASVMKMFTNLPTRTEISRKLHSARSGSFSKIDHSNMIKMLPNLLTHPAFMKRRCITTESDSAIDMFYTFQEHAHFSKQLVSTDRDLHEYIGELVAEWVRRFEYLGAVDAHTVAGALNALSKLDINDGIWRKEDQGSIKRLIVKLSLEGNKLLGVKTEGSFTFNAWQIANTLNALSKWNVLKPNLWGDDNVKLFSSFIIRLINQGNWISAEKFNSQSIGNIVNALSKWDIDEFPGARQLVVRLMKQGVSIVRVGRNDPGSFTSLTIVRCLNAVSKWNVNDLQGAKLFIVKLMEQGTLMSERFNSQEISNSLNAVSKWNIHDLSAAQKFITGLLKRGNFIADKFSCQAISNSLNALSKWNIEDLEGAKEFIVELSKQGNSMAKGFNSQEIANSLNAMSKWNIDELPGARDFIVQLVKWGTSTAHTFNSQGISSSLNALSKWNPNDLKGSRELIIVLVKRANATVNTFNFQSIVAILNALSKWKIDEIQGARKFIVKLLEHSSSMVDGFDSLAVSNSLNALCKWNVDEFEGAREFINQLLKRGSSIGDSFNSQNIAISLNALAKWNINELRGTREFIVCLASRGTFVANKFNYVGISSSLNALHRICIFDDKKWHNDQLKILKNFIIEIVEKGLTIYEQFDALNVALAFNSFSTLHIFNDDLWTKDEQSKMINFIVSLSSVDTPYHKYTLESISKTYVTLFDWNIFDRDQLDSSQLKSIENLISNLESRIVSIAEQHLENPENDITFAVQIITEMPKIKSKLLIVSETQFLVCLLRCISNGVQNCTDIRLRESFTQQNILSGLLGLREGLSYLEDTSSLKGAFDKSLYIICKKFAGLNLTRLDEVLDLIDEFDKLGIIKNTDFCKFRPSGS